MVINAAQILRFVALSTRMNLYKLLLLEYFAIKIGDFGARIFMGKQSFSRNRANLKCVRDVNLDMVIKQKGPIVESSASFRYGQTCYLGDTTDPGKPMIWWSNYPIHAWNAQQNCYQIYAISCPVETMFSGRSIRNHSEIHTLHRFENIWRRIGTEAPGRSSSHFVFVSCLCENLAEGCAIYMDRFFTGLGVFRWLHEKKLNLTGTVQRSRLPRSLRDKLLPEKAERDSSRPLINRHEDIALTCWKNSRVVLLLSSCYNIQPETSRSRWVKGQKTKRFREPNSVAKNNAHMGGVNLMDRMLALNPHFAYRTNKWTVRVILHSIMLAAIINWFERGKPMRLFDYTILLRDEKLVHARKLKNCCGFLSEEVMQIQPVPLPTLRISDGRFPVHGETIDASRSLHGPSKKACGGKSLWMSLKCNFPLCLNEQNNCFKLFHLISWFFYDFKEIGNF